MVSNLLSISRLQLSQCRETAVRHGDRWLKKMAGKARYHLRKAGSDPDRRELGEKLAILEEVLSRRASERNRLSSELEQVRGRIAVLEAELPSLRRMEAKLAWESREAGRVSERGQGELHMQDPDFWRKLALCHPAPRGDPQGI
jgi:chromosome segregation ATPase